MPVTSVLVCSTQRSGTTLLCQALTHTDAMGRPEEYFLDWEHGQYGVGSSAPREYLQSVYELGTTPNGVFGAKLMWNYFDSTVRQLRSIPGFKGLDLPALLGRAFPALRIVLLTRRDRVRQAVSWARASQDGVWVVSGQEPVRPESTPTYDFVLISNLEKLIVEGERGWRSLCDRLGVVPIEVVYEDLGDDADDAVRMIASELGLRPANKSRFQSTTKKQAGPINEEWTERYRRDRIATGTAAAPTDGET